MNYYMFGGQPLALPGCAKHKYKDILMFFLSFSEEIKCFQLVPIDNQ